MPEKNPDSRPPKNETQAVKGKESLYLSGTPASAQEGIAQTAQEGRPNERRKMDTRSINRRQWKNAQNQMAGAGGGRGGEGSA